VVSSENLLQRRLSQSGHRLPRSVLYVDL